MHFILFFLLAWFIIACFIKPTKKQPIVKEESYDVSAWKDFGNHVEILGHKFIANGYGGYEYNGLLFATHIATNINHYSIHPNISLTQEEFLARLESYK